MFLRHGARTLEKILAPSERVECNKLPDPAGFLAKRFAAKEALAKALGRGLRTPLLLPAIAIKHHDSGQPYFELAANAADLLDKKLTVHLSISDEREFALAFVVLEKP